MNKNITIRNSQSAESLLKESAEQPLLTLEQEVELADRIKQGDNEALAELYNSNLRFVVSVAKQYQDRGKSLEELIEVGSIGLELAVRKFDPKRGFKFISYAVWFIRASIVASLGSTKYDVDPSEYTEDDKREMVSKCSNERESEILNERESEILVRWLGIAKPQESLEEIGQSMNLTAERVKQLRDRAIARLAAQKDK